MSIISGTLTSWALVLHGTKTMPINLKSETGRSSPPTTPVFSTVPSKVREYSHFDISFNQEILVLAS